MGYWSWDSVGSVGKYLPSLPAVLSGPDLNFSMTTFLSILFILGFGPLLVVRRGPYGVPEIESRSAANKARALHTLFSLAPHDHFST